MLGLSAAWASIGASIVANAAGFMSRRYVGFVKIRYVMPGCHYPAAGISMLSSRWMYISMAWRISPVIMYSSAVWDRAESPGPSFSDGHRSRAWSLSVGERWGESHHRQPPYQRVSVVDRRRRKPHRPWLERAFGYRLTYHGEGLLVGVGVGGAHVHDYAATVGNHIVLCACVDLGDRDPYRAECGRHLGQFEPGEGCRLSRSRGRWR